MTNYQPTLTDNAILTKIGNKIEQARIRKNLTQATLAKEAGIGKRTLERLESGASVQLTSFIRTLRALDLIENFLQLIPDPEISPMAQLLAEKKTRYRASKTKPETPTDTWEWND